MLLDRPAQLTHTAPDPSDTVNFALTGYDWTAYSQLVAKPYDLVKGRIAPTAYPSYFGPSAGLLSSVSDLATYSIAIDEGRFLQAATWEQVFTPFRSPKGKVLPYGLGWFIRSYKGVKVLWHTGLWTGTSSLLVKFRRKT